MYLGRGQEGLAYVCKIYDTIRARNLNIIIFGQWTTWRTIIFYIFISIPYMSRATSCSSSGESIVSIQHLVYVTLCRWPFRDIYQMLYWYNWFSWWWARGCSKHVGNWNKYIEKNYASSWSLTKNHNKLHDQQNIKFWISQFRPYCMKQHYFKKDRSYADFYNISCVLHTVVRKLAYINETLVVLDGLINP